MSRKTASGDNVLCLALIFPAALFLLYFFAVQFGVLKGYPLPAVLVLIGVLAVGIYPGLKRGDKTAWVLLSISLAAGLFLWLSGYLAVLFYLPSLIINLMFLVVFSVSVLPGNTPLITRFSMIMKGELDAKAYRYTYRVTLAWAIFFAFLLFETLLLAFFAPPRIWSIFANFLNYVFLLLFFVVEYRIRITLFPEVDHPGFFGFVLDLLRLDWRHIGLGFRGEPELDHEGKRG